MHIFKGLRASAISMELPALNYHESSLSLLRAYDIMKAE